MSDRLSDLKYVILHEWLNFWSHLNVSNTSFSALKSRPNSIYPSFTHFDICSESFWYSASVIRIFYRLMRRSISAILLSSFINLYWHCSSNYCLCCCFSISDYEKSNPFLKLRCQESLPQYSRQTSCLYHKVIVLDFCR